jgi:prephenate dehydrogenase
LARLRPNLRKLCVVWTYINIEEVVTIVEIERLLGELGETPYEPMKEEHDEIMSGKSTTNH